MSQATFHIGDVRDVLATLPDGSIDLALSSPPFLALRSYLPADDPLKSLEIGSEQTPADYLDTLLDVVEAITPKLAPHGSLVWELGDTYSGSGGAGGDYAEQGLRPHQPKFDGSGRRNAHKWEGRRDAAGYEGHPLPDMFKGGGPGGAGWPMAKSLCGIPTLFSWSLAYGRNLLRPERTTDPWRIRNLCVWARPNPPVGALGDKVRPATSYLTVACKARDRYFDLDAIRHKHSKPDGNGMMRAKTQVTGARSDDGKSFYNEGHPAGAPPNVYFIDDVWELSTSPYEGSHYATWPPKLCEPFIESMCPKKVCLECGQPSVRLTERTEEYAAYREATGDFLLKDAKRRDVVGLNAKQSHLVPTERYRTVGWSDCGHNAWRNGVVLDCFGGSGTTGAVAVGHGRDAVLIDLDGRNADLAYERIGGLFVEIIDHRQKESA